MAFQGRPPTEPPAYPDTTRTIRWAVGIGAVLSLYLFGDCIFGSKELGFRDVRHFYLPLFEYLQARSATAWFPLWSPLDQFGASLAGEPTSAIFYLPRILIFSCLSIEAAIAVYVLIHLWWAGIGTVLLARKAGANVAFSALSAFAYPLSGCVFFLYTNPPFLVGAAWLPWIIATFLRLKDRDSGRRQITVAAICLATCVLGGDPQTALHAILVIGAFVVVERWKASQWLRLGGAIVLALLLAMPQIAASVSWSSSSHRYAQQSVTPFNVSFARPDPGTHADQMYDFSVAPWHLVELVTPYASGPLLPVNGRISKLVPGEPRMWTPTLYCGLVPFLVLLMTGYQQRYRTEWLWLAIIGLGFCLGRFGIAMFIRTSASWLGLDFPQTVDDALGGPYWWLVSFLPGYGNFRYPAKWLAIAALGLCIHASVVVTRLDADLPNLLRRYSLIAAAVALSFLVLSYVPIVVDQFILLVDLSEIADRFWGPLNAEAALSSVRLSLLQTTAVGMGFTSICHLYLKDDFQYRHLVTGILLISIVDLSLCANWQLRKIPTYYTEGITRFDEFPSRYIAIRGGQQWPTEWQFKSDPNRLTEVEQAQRTLWYRRWYLSDGVAVLNGTVSIPTDSSIQFWREAGARYRELGVVQRPLFLESLARFLSADALVSPEIMDDQIAKRFTPVTNSQPSIRWHSNWIPRSELAIDSIRQWMIDINTVEKHLPIVASQIAPPIANAVVDDQAAKVSEVEWSPERIFFQVNSSREGLVQVMQMQDGGWKASYSALESNDWKDIEVVSVDHISQGFLLPSGQWKVKLYYSPDWWWPSWLAFGIGVVTAGSSLTRQGNLDDASR